MKLECQFRISHSISSFTRFFLVLVFFSVSTTPETLAQAQNEGGKHDKREVEAVNVGVNCGVDGPKVSYKATLNGIKCNTEGQNQRIECKSLPPPNNGGKPTDILILSGTISAQDMGWTVVSCGFEYANGHFVPGKLDKKGTNPFKCTTELDHALLLSQGVARAVGGQQVVFIQPPSGSGSRDTDRKFAQCFKFILT